VQLLILCDAPLRKRVMLEFELIGQVAFVERHVFMSSPM